MNNESGDAPAIEAIARIEPDSLLKPAAVEAVEAPRSTAHQAMDAIVTGGRVAGDKLTEAARLTGKTAGKAAVLIGDLNDDGKVDEEDAKIAAATARDVAAKTADEAGGFLKEIAKHDVFKDAAAFALIGAVIAVPIPLVGPAFGAAVGAIGGLAKNIFFVAREIETVFLYVKAHL